MMVNTMQSSKQSDKSTVFSFMNICHSHANLERNLTEFLFFFVHHCQFHDPCNLIGSEFAISIMNILDYYYLWYSILFEQGLL